MRLSCGLGRPALVWLLVTAAAVGALASAPIEQLHPMCIPTQSWIPLNSTPSGYYSLTLSLGGLPHQNMTVVISTDTARLFVVEAGSAYCSMGLTCFNASADPLFQWCHSCKVYDSTICRQSLINVALGPLWATNYYACMMEMDLFDWRFWPFGLYGLFGLAYDGRYLEATGFRQMFPPGVPPVWGLQLTPRSGGVLTLGGWDCVPGTADTSMVWSEMQLRDRPDQHEFAMYSPTMCGILLLGNKTAAWMAKISTTSLPLYMPADMAAAVRVWINKSLIGNCQDTSASAMTRYTPSYCVLTDAGRAADLPSIHFSLSASYPSAFEIDLDWLRCTVSVSGQLTACLCFGTSTNYGDESRIVLGTLVLHHVDMVLDMGRHRVGLRPVPEEERQRRARQPSPTSAADEDPDPADWPHGPLYVPSERSPAAREAHPVAERTSTVADSQFPSTVHFYDEPPLLPGARVGEAKPLLSVERRRGELNLAAHSSFADVRHQWAQLVSWHSEPPQRDAALRSPVHRAGSPNVSDVSDTEPDYDPAVCAQPVWCVPPYTLDLLDNTCEAPHCTAYWGQHYDANMQRCDSFWAFLIYPAVVLLVWGALELLFNEWDSRLLLHLVGTVPQTPHFVPTP